MTTPHPDLAAMVESGWTDPMIADHYGVHRHTVATWRKAEGLPANDGRKGTLAHHGTFARYDYGCRCVECRDANTAEHKRLREERRLRGLSPADPRHGTYTGYANWGCRCNPCRAAKSEANRRRYYAARDKAEPIEESS